MAHNNDVLCVIYNKDIAAVSLECPCRSKFAQKESLLSEDCEAKGISACKLPFSSLLQITGNGLLKHRTDLLQ